jgi:hypothetical protein
VRGIRTGKDATEGRSLSRYEKHPDSVRLGGKLVSLAVARRHLDAVATAAREREQAQAKLRAAIIAARDSGETLDDIGKAAGLTRQRIAQIVAGE